MLAIAAFDIVAPMAEESKTPRSLVPKATILVTIGAGVYWVVTAFGLINAVAVAGGAWFGPVRWPVLRRTYAVVRD